MNMRTMYYVGLLAVILGTFACGLIPGKKSGMEGTFIRLDTTPVFVQGDTITIQDQLTPKGRTFRIERRTGTRYFEDSSEDSYDVDTYVGSIGSQPNIIDVTNTEWHWIIDHKLGILQSGKRIYFRQP